MFLHEPLQYPINVEIYKKNALSHVLETVKVCSYFCLLTGSTESFHTLCYTHHLIAAGVMMFTVCPRTLSCSGKFMHVKMMYLTCMCIPCSVFVWLVGTIATESPTVCTKRCSYVEACRGIIPRSVSVLGISGDIERSTKKYVHVHAHIHALT